MSISGMYTKPKHLIGAYLPKEHASHLALLAFTQGRSVSKVLKELIIDYLAKHPSPDELQDIVVDEMHKEWEAWFTDNQGKPGWRTPEHISNKWQKFKEGVFESLGRKKIDKERIKYIMNLADKREIRK